MEEITAEYDVSQLIETVELKVKPTLTVGCKSDMGRVRENNEDKYEYFLADETAALASKGHIFLVCDGMGGHEAGQIASELATKTFIDVYLNHPSLDPESALKSSVAAANRYVLDVARAVPSRRNMGTTLSAFIVLQNQGFIAQVGDSRVYRVRDKSVEQLTVDHTWVEEMVRGGVMSRDVAETHPNRHMLLRAIGAEGEANPDIFTFSLMQGDKYLLCSDGLTNHVSDEEIRKILDENGPSEAAWALVSMALIGGGSDNVTCIVVRIDALEDVTTN